MSPTHPLSHSALIAMTLLSVITLSGCSNLTTTQQRMLTGGAAGTVVGAATTVMTGGCVACGAALGGAIGTGAGYVMDKMDKKKNKN